MLGTSHTSNKTDSIYDNRKQEGIMGGNKFHKKNTESYKSSIISNMEGYDEPTVE